MSKSKREQNIQESIEKWSFYSNDNWIFKAIDFCSYFPAISFTVQKIGEADRTIYLSANDLASMCPNPTHKMHKEDARRKVEGLWRNIEILEEEEEKDRELEND
jgi:hypothetical protein